MGDEGTAPTFTHRLNTAWTTANSHVGTWALLLIFGTMLGKPTLTITLLAILYTAVITAELFTYHASPLTITLIFLLGIVVNNTTALALITALFLTELAFNHLVKFTIRPIYHIAPIGLELVVFNTVLIGHLHGPIAGAITGLLFGSAYYGIVFNFDSTYQYINIPAYAVIGYLAGTLTGAFTTIGITLAATYAITTTAIITLAYGGKLTKGTIFITTNLLFNYWLFTGAGHLIQ
jgi:hypothetical protein